jgi:hypothetical protein
MFKIKLGTLSNITVAFVLASALACGHTSGSAAPEVSANSPLDGATNVDVNGIATVTFNEPMEPSTLTAATFTVASGGTAVSGTVTTAGATATFWPAAYLATGTKFTATIGAGVTNLAGVDLGTSHTWTFTTGSTVGQGIPVDLGTAGGFVILAKSGIATVPASVITGDLGLSPAAATFITGFSLIADSTNVFSTSAQVTGKAYAADYAAPTPANLTSAIGDMQTAFTSAAGRAPGVTELGAGNIGGLTLTPNVYKWGTGVLVPTDVTLTGSATDVWVFQIAKDLTFSSGAKVVLAGGAVPQNIFWQVSGLVDLGTTASCQGVVLSQTSITLQTGASVTGRLLAQTAVSVDNSAVALP